MIRSVTKHMSTTPATTKATPVVPTARESVDAIAAAKDDISKRLARCRALPAYRGEHFLELRAITAALDSFIKRQGEMILEFNAGARAKVAEKKSLAEAKDAEIQAIQQRHDNAQPQARATIQQERQEAQRARQQMGAEISKLEESARNDQNVGMDQPHEGLRDLREEVMALLDRSSAIERELTTKETLRTAVEADTAQREDDFARAESVHRRQAFIMLLAMLGIITLAVAVVILLFFVFAQPPALASGPAEAAGRWAVAEQVVLVGIGRLAILFFAAWGLKYTGSLHRMHAEQAVIYCDRRAALGVMRTILDATPSTEQRREVLKLLAESYLNFEQSAFRTKPGEANSRGDDGEATTVKQAVETLRPVVDVLKGLLDKGK